MQQSRGASKEPGHPVTALPAPSCQLSIFTLVILCLLVTAGVQVLTLGPKGGEGEGRGCPEPLWALYQGEDSFSQKPPSLPSWAQTHPGSARWAGHASPQTESGLAPRLRKEGTEEVGDQEHLPQRAFHGCQH